MSIGPYKDLREEVECPILNPIRSFKTNLILHNLLDVILIIVKPSWHMEETCVAIPKCYPVQSSFLSPYRLQVPVSHPPLRNQGTEITLLLKAKTYRFNLMHKVINWSMQVFHNLFFITKG